jgi:hypothetical protein
MRRLKSFWQRKRVKTCAKMQRWRDAKERKRLASDEPVRVEWRGRLEHSITFHNRLTGEMHTLDLRRGKRRDQFAAEVDGKPWRTINATQLGKLVRDKFKPHIKE